MYSTLMPMAFPVENGLPGSRPRTDWGKKRLVDSSEKNIHNSVERVTLTLVITPQALSQIPTPSNSQTEVVLRLTISGSLPLLIVHP